MSLTIELAKKKNNKQRKEEYLDALNCDKFFHKLCHGLKFSHFESILHAILNFSSQLVTRELSNEQPNLCTNPNKKRKEYFFVISSVVKDSLEIGFIFLYYIEARLFYSFLLGFPSKHLKKTSKP